MPPVTRYARNGDLKVAYQVVGAGTEDLVYVPGFASHVEFVWQEPRRARFLDRLSTYRRLILFDRRGTGMSDRVPPDQLPTMEERVDDIRAVMDAAGSEQAALLGWSEGGSLAAMFAATHPERTSSLVVYGAFARFLLADDYPWGLSLDAAILFRDALVESWGEPSDLMGAWGPSVMGDADLKEHLARDQRLSASPGAAEALCNMVADTDARGILHAVRVPTLVIHRTGDTLFSVEHGRYFADHIADARFVEVPGDDHLWWLGDQDAILDEIEEFLTGVRPAHDADRVLATVLFTDIVGSTEKAVEFGDRRWRELLDSHEGVVRRELERHGGREVKTTGDGFLALFDGPARGIRCACSIRDAVRSLGIRVRAGLHTGECEQRGDDVGGIAVHIGARVAALADADEVLVSRTVSDLVAGSGIAFEDRGAHQLKGVPGEWQLHAVAGGA